MASVTFAGITKSFGNFDVIPPLDLKIEDEEFIVFVGPSGCGKSTLLRLISGLEQVSDGEIYIGDELVNSIAPSKRDIAMVFQDYALYPHMTVRNNMTFALERQRMPKDEIARRVERVARQLQITQYLDRRPKALSGGQRQRVAMGRAMVREPRVFLFDEPLSNLDAKLRVDVRGEIKALAKELRTTMVFVTHDQVEAMTLADRIVILEAGRIQQVGTPQEVYSQPANLFVAGFIGSPPMNFFDCTRKGSDLILRNERVIKPVGNLARVLSSASGDEFVLGVRPEHLIPTEISAADIVAQIGVVEPLGPDTLCTFDLAGKRAMVRVDPDLQPQPDDALPLRINLDKAHLFDPADSGVCLTSKLAGA